MGHPGEDILHAILQAGSQTGRRRCARHPHKSLSPHSATAQRRRIALCLSLEAGLTASLSLLVSFASARLTALRPQIAEEVLRERLAKKKEDPIDPNDFAHLPPIVVLGYPIPMEDLPRLYKHVFPLLDAPLLCLFCP